MREFFSGLFWGLPAAAAGLALFSLGLPPPAGNRPPEPPLTEAPAEVARALTDTGPRIILPGRAARDARPAPAAALTAPALPAALPRADRRDPPRPPDLPALQGLVAPAAAGAASPAPGQAFAPMSGLPPRPLHHSLPGAAPATPVAEAAPPLPALPPGPRGQAPVIAEVAPTLPVPDARWPAARPGAATSVPAGASAALRAPPRAPASPAPEAPLPGGQDRPAAVALGLADPVRPAAPVAAGAALPPADGGAGRVQTATDTPAMPVLPGRDALPAATGTPQPEAAPVPRRRAPLPQIGVTSPDTGGEAFLPVRPAEAGGLSDLPGQDGVRDLPGGGNGPRVIRPGTAAAVTAPAADSALLRHAAAFQPSGDLPRLSLVLTDDGGRPDAVALVADLPWPVTVAIDPGRPGATAAMAAYRAAGIEVLALLRLPDGARPADVAVTMEAVFALLPETIGILDTGEGGLRRPGAARDQALARLAADGRAALVLPGGLGMVADAAAAAGVPLAVIAREIDGGFAGRGALDRLLDRAAFRARQSAAPGQAGGTILLGPLDAALTQATAGWMVQTGSDKVEVVPVSVILRESLPGPRPATPP